MIDALLYSIRDGIRAAGLGYDASSCEIMDDERPPPRCGNYFVSVHSGMMTSDMDNVLNEWYSFSLTLTMRVTVPLDRVGDQIMARNIARVPLGERQGFYAKADRLRSLHMSWKRTVLLGQNPPSANDNLKAWAPDGATVYGFIEPMRFLSIEAPKLVGGEWFSADPEAEDVGIKSTLQFGKCRRVQPHNLPEGPFV